jgi:nucleotide-binding universal stress UspA family protein
VKIERIVVGVDGSDNARKALGWAAQLARALDAEVVAVHSVGLLERFASGQHEDLDSTLDDARHLFDTEWCTPLDDPTVRSTRLLRDGNPVTVLLAVADEFDAGLIVVGSRGLGGYPELLLGSTSTQVAQHSTRPVVIVPAVLAETSA